jgi:hypothetical protein
MNTKAKVQKYKHEDDWNGCYRGVARRRECRGEAAIPKVMKTAPRFSAREVVFERDQITSVRMPMR